MQGQVLSAEDFHIIAEGISMMLLTAIGVRILSRVLLPRGN